MRFYSVYITLVTMVIETNNSKHIAVPPILQFFVGLTIQGVFTSLSTLLVDLNPKSSSAALAGMNSGKCEVAAGGLAFLDVLIRRSRPG